MSAFWVRRWSQKWSSSPASRPASSARPALALEHLEAREVPATLAVVNGSLVFTAGAGVNNATAVSVSGSTITVADSAEAITTDIAGATGSGTNSVTVPTAGITAVTLDVADGTDTLGAVATAGRALTIAHAGAGLTLGGAVATANGVVTVSSANGLTITADVNAGNAKISLAVNTDGAGNQGLTQTNGNIVTTNTTLDALTITANTAAGGTGNISIDNTTVGSNAGGRVNLSSNGGSVLYGGTAALTESQTGLVNGGSAPARLIRAREYNFTSTGAGSIGTDARPIQASSFGTDGINGNSFANLNAGSGGVFFIKWSGIDLQLESASTTGAGSIRIVTPNVGGNNLNVRGNVSAVSGNIFLGSDDDMQVLGSSVIGGPGFSGTIFMLANRDEGTAGQTFAFSPESLIQTTNTTNVANPGGVFSPTTQAVYLQISGDGGNPSNLRVGNIITGNGGRVVINAVPNGTANVQPGPEAGRIQMASSNNLIDVGATGAVRLLAGLTNNAAIDVIGSPGAPLRVAGGTVEFTATLGNVYVTGLSATKVTGSQTAEVDDNQTATGGLVSITTTAGALTVSGPLNAANNGTFNLDGAGGVVIAAGATLGSPTTGAIRIVGGLSGTGSIALGTGDLTVLQATDTSYSGAISGVRNVFKEGSGTLTLAGTSPFVGVTVVDTGVVNLTGNLTGAGGVAVRANGVFGGTGKVSGPVAVAGRIAPGTAGVGTLGTGNLSFTSDAAYVAEVGTAAADGLAVTGAAELGGRLRVLLTGTPTVGTSFTIVANDGTDPVVGGFLNAPNGSVIRAFNNPGYAFTVNTAGGDGNDVVLTLTSIDTFATGVIEVFSGRVFYSAAAGVNNAVTVSLSGGNYTIADAAGSITLSASAIAAGFTQSGNSVVGPAAGVTGLSFNLADGTDSLGAVAAGAAGVSVSGTGTLALDGPVTTDAGVRIADFTQVGGAGTISAPGNVTIVGGTTGTVALGTVNVVTGDLSIGLVNTVTAVAADSLLSAADLTISTTGGIGIAGAPIRTAATAITAVAQGGGVFLRELDGAVVTVTESGVGSIAIASDSGTLEITNAIALSQGDLAVSSGDAVILNGDVNLNVGTITITANADGVGSEGYDQRGAAVSTGNESATGLVITVNTVAGGTGTAVLGKGTVGTNAGGTVTVQTFKGVMAWSSEGYAPFTASQTGLGNGGSSLETLKAATFVLNGGGVGTNDRPLQLEAQGANGVRATPSLTGTGGNGGFYVTAWDSAGNRDLTLGDVTVNGTGGIRVVTANANGHNLFVTGTVTGGSGTIHLAADDNLDFQAGALVGGAGFSGTVYLQGNRDQGTGGQPVTFAPTAAIVTSNTTNVDTPLASRTLTTQAVYIDIAGGTDTAPGVIQVANITTGDGGRVVLSGVSPLSPAQSGLVRMAAAASVINVGTTGTVEIIGRQINATATVNATVGSATLPIRVAGGNVVIDSNYGNVFVTSDAAVGVTAKTTATIAGQTGAPGLTLATTSGVLTVTGPVSTANGGAVTLTGVGGVTIASGATVGSATTGAIAVNGPLAGAGSIALGTGNLTVTQATPSQFDGSISGSQNFVKAGAGPLALAGTSPFTGTTTVSAGALVLNGASLTGTSRVTTATGTTLGGNGTIAGPIAVGGILSPGLANSGLLNTGSLSFTPGGVLTVNLAGTAVGTGYDQVNVTGTVNLANAKLDATSTFSPATGAAFVIVANDGTDAVTGQLLDSAGVALAEGATVTISGRNYTLSYSGGDGNDVTLTAQIDPNATPEVVGPVAVNNGMAQRSRLTTLTVTFDRAVNLSANAFTLTQLTNGSGTPTNTAVPNAHIVVTLRAGTTATYDLTFTGTGLVQSGSLADGTYQLRINAAGVTNAASGQAMTGDFVTPTTGPGRLYRLFGDVNGDSQVDFRDLTAFDLANGTSAGDAGFLGAVDVNNDGQIDFRDFTAFDLNNGLSL